MTRTTDVVFQSTKQDLHENAKVNPMFFLPWNIKNFKKTLAMHFETVIVAPNLWGSRHFYSAFRHYRHREPFSRALTAGLPSVPSALQTSGNLSRRQLRS